MLKKVLIIVALILAIAGVLAWKGYQKEASATHQIATGASFQDSLAKPVPKLVDFGSTHCIPCKKMEPILEELQREYQGVLEVVFIDTEKYPEYAKQYKIELIPTQIFLDPLNQELFRHEGFFPKQDILKKWQDLNISLK